MPQLIPVDRSDLLKIADALSGASAFFEHRDRMNASVHLAGEVRFAPLTSEVLAARDRLAAILESREIGE